MEPTPPAPTGGSNGSSPLRLHPRGRVPSLSWDLGGLQPPHPSSNQHHQQRRLQAKVSPRHVKLQSVHAIASLSLPVYATATLRDQLHGQFRNELFQFHQLLQDAQRQCISHNRQGTTENALAGEMESSRAVLDVITTDRHAAVMKELFHQWQRVQTAPGRHDPSEQELLGEVVETIFRNLPTVLTDADVRNAKSFMRYIDALKALRELVLSLIYKTDESRVIDGVSGEDEDENDHVVASPTSTLFASTAALLESLGGVKKVSAPLSARSPAHPKRIPLYLYCQQLERELEVLRRRIRNLRGGVDTGKDDVGLLSDQTLSLLLQFWELPRLQRLAFFCQVASQGKIEDCDTVLQVFVEKCSNDRLLSVWDTLQLTPHVQQAIAIRKHGDDAEAAAREAAEALAAANEERKQKHDDEESGENDEEEDDDFDETTSRRRRGGRVQNLVGRGGHRPSQRQVDISGLADAFDDEDDNSDGDGGGSDGWSHSGGGKRRRRKIRIRDRGRTPEGQRHHHSSHHGHHRQHHSSSKHDESRRSSRVSSGGEDSKARPVSRGRDGAKPSTPKPVLDRAHSDLLELLNADDPNIDSVVIDAAWKLVELIDQSKRKSTIVPRGAVGHASASQNIGKVASKQTAEDALGRNLTADQHFVVKIDQLHSLLSSLGSVSLHTMTNDTIAAAFKRLPGLQRLFQNFSGKTYQAVGLDASAAAMPMPSMPMHLSTPPSGSRGSSYTTSSHTGTTNPASAAPMWGDDQVLGSVEVMLGKLGKMVRSLAPIADVRVGDAAEGGTSASAEILKLAETMEELMAGESTEDSGNDSLPGRRRLSMDPGKRLAVLSRLKALAQGNQIESLTCMLVTTCDEIITLKTVSEHQQLQLEQFSATQSAAPRSRGKALQLVDADTESGLVSEDENGSAGIDDFIRNAKKAKIRRASAAKTATSSSSGGGNKDEDDDEDDDASMSMTASRFANRLDIPQNIKQATAQRGSKLFHVSILLRVVDQMYREHYETMLSSLQYGSRRMEFSEFMYDWHIRKYGLKSLAQQHLLKLIQSLRKYERKVFPCQLCLRFLGIVSGLGYHEHKFVLGLLDKWSFGTFSAASKHRIEHAPRQFKIRVTFAISTIQEALNERFGVYFRSMDAVSTRIKAQAIRHDEEFIKESDLLTVAIDEWLAQRQRIEQILEAVYTAGDVNGDGSLEYDEFSAVMSHLSPSLDDKFLQRVFTAAHDYLKPRRISFARFLDVILLERVLNTSQSGKSKQTGQSADRRDVASAASSSSSAAASSGDAGATARLSAEEEETYQFNLLEETWEQDREIVAQSLSAITHQQTVATIQFRVSFLTQILNKRVDSKTAWMCHRQIMREISRFQNMNEDQIVAVKKKEETFKKAVLAIRNLQRLSMSLKMALGGSISTESRPNESDPPAPDDTVGSPSASETTPSTAPDLHGLRKQTSYVSVVQGALSAADRSNPSSIAEFEALEDQLREKFLARADEGAIDDFKSALQTIRRISMQAFPQDLDLEQLRAQHAQEKDRRVRSSVGALGGAVYEDDEEDEDDEGDGDEGEED